MDVPTLPSVPPGRSALPALLVVERALEAQIAAEVQKASEETRDAGDEAARIRREGQARLERVLVEAQEAAMREAEARVRARVNDARSRVTRWVDEAERASDTAVEEALDLCCGDGV